jgi:glucose-6-phosphate isomerase
MDKLEQWQRFVRYLCVNDELGLRLDISRMSFDDAVFEKMSSAWDDAVAAMVRLESGQKANIDEEQMVGHYWLRAAQRSPDSAIERQINQTIDSVKAFCNDVHAGKIQPPRADGFYVLLVIGIGGSALGAQFICDALSTVDDPMLVRFIDNTDPDGMDRTLAEVDEMLDQTLTLVVSKSGTTVETANGLAEVSHAYAQSGLDFAKHAVAISCAGSRLHQRCEQEGWVKFFPVWDWVGGRTSATSAAGLLPLGLQGGDVAAFLDGARDCDQVTRQPELRSNPAGLLALMWHAAGAGRGDRNMVILPYRDRLLLLGRYLQQLVMESIGKAQDRAGRTVHQGLSVFGNKGSTDQHALVQQLRDGRDDFFAVFVEVLQGRSAESVQVREGVTSGDCLSGFLQGTRLALSDGGRPSMTITLETLNARTVGALIALFERAVGFYAEFINVNAYHQPGVEAGKKAAEAVLTLQATVFNLLRDQPGTPMSAEEIAKKTGRVDDVETVFHILEHAAGNADHAIVRVAGESTTTARFKAI